MRVVVFDVPAAESGALTVLLDFFHHVQKLDREDIEWFFVVSTDVLGEPRAEGRIRVLRYPAEKHSWRRRIAFELFAAPRLVRQCQADVILSLQNTAILWTRVPQVVYVHNSIPYAPSRFSYWRREERSLAVIGDIFRPLIGWSIRKSRHAVVQTKWLKRAIEARHGIPPEKISVLPVAANIHLPPGELARRPGRFFYPAGPLAYKCHGEIVEAVSRLRREGHSPTVVFTIDGNENGYSRRIAKRIEELDLGGCIQLAGRIPREEMGVFYRESVLLFVSRLESFGLPLLEARMLGAPVVATRQPFAEEILDGYEKAALVPQGNAASLSDAMRCFCISPSEFDSPKASATSTDISRTGGWDTVVELLLDAHGKDGV